MCSVGWVDGNVKFSSREPPFVLPILAPIAFINQFTSLFASFFFFLSVFSKKKATRSRHPFLVSNALPLVHRHWWMASLFFPFVHFPSPRAHFSKNAETTTQTLAKNTQSIYSSGSFTIWRQGDDNTNGGQNTQQILLEDTTSRFNLQRQMSIGPRDLAAYVRSTGKHGAQLKEKRTFKLKTLPSFWFGGWVKPCSK